MRDAVADLVRDGDTVAIEGFTHLICFAAGHEIIRQRKRDLTLCRMTPDVIYDQMVGAGVASKLVFSWLGNPGVGSLHAIRRRIEGVDGIVERSRGALEPLDASQHLLGNIVVEVNGDDATSVCYFQAQHVRAGTPGGDTYFIAGSYADRLVRTPQGWRIVAVHRY